MNIKKSRVKSYGYFSSMYVCFYSNQFLSSTDSRVKIIDLVLLYCKTNFSLIIVIIQVNFSLNN